MKELSIFVDESGNIGTDSIYYAITLVFHEQSESIAPYTAPYRRFLQNASLQDIPFHFTPLMRAHDQYVGFEIERRKQYLSAFRVLALKLPYRYLTLCYRKREFASTASLEKRMKRDLVRSLTDNLEYLQTFDQVKIYYDNGQKLITDVVHCAIESVLAQNAIIYRMAIPSSYRLLQIADFICTIEVVAEKYQSHEEKTTDRIFFGEWGSFKKNYLKKIRKKRID